MINPKSTTVGIEPRTSRVVGGSFITSATQPVTLIELEANIRVTVQSYDTAKRAKLTTTTCADLPHVQLINSPANMRHWLN